MLRATRSRLLACSVMALMVAMFAFERRTQLRGEGRRAMVFAGGALPEGALVPVVEVDAADLEGEDPGPCRVDQAREPGAPGENWLLPQGDQDRAERVPDKCTIGLKPGNVLRMLRPGGGGWGAPHSVVAGAVTSNVCALPRRPRTPLAPSSSSTQLRLRLRPGSFRPAPLARRGQGERHWARH